MDRRAILKGAVEGLVLAAMGKAVFAAEGANQQGSARNAKSAQSALGTSLEEKLIECVSVRDFGAVGDGVRDDTVAIQAAINSARGKKIYLPKGTYKTTATLTINSVVNGSATPFELFGDGFDANGGRGGTSINFSGASDCILIANTGSTDTQITLRDFGVFGDGIRKPGGHGINVQNCSNVRLRSMWIQGHRDCGVNFFKCYGASIEDSYVFGNRLFGIRCNQAFNLGNIRRCKLYQNGMVWSQMTAAIYIYGAGNESLGVVIEDCDVSYSGSGVNWYRRSDSSLSSINVSSGVAKVTTASAHGRSTNDQVFITGSTAAALNSVYPETITVTGATTFTFPTGAADGLYTERTLRIAPYACGIFIADAHGITIGAYCEESAGLAAYIGPNVHGFDIRGGYWQGANGSGLILLDNPSHGKIGAMRMNGMNAGVSAQMTNRPHGVDIQSSISLASSASIVYPTFKLVDGTYYGATAPTTGGWSKGTYIKQSTPTVGQPKGWYCTANGTPGTWVSEGNL